MDNQERRLEEVERPLQLLKAGDWKGALASNRRHYEELFKRYSRSIGVEKEALAEQLEYAADSGMQLADISSRMNSFLGEQDE